MRFQILTVFSFLILSSASTSFAQSDDNQTIRFGYKNRPTENFRNPNWHRNDDGNGNSPTSGSGDSAIVNLVKSRRPANFVSGSGMVVTQVLPDDNQGLEHQKFIVQLSDGSHIMAVYNTDMCPSLPEKVGDRVGLAGQFIWTNQGGLIHWLHHDPKNHRPDGFVEINGQRYCDK